VFPANREISRSLIDWADTAMKRKMTCSPRGGDANYVTGFKPIWILSVPQHIDPKCITIQNLEKQQARSGMWTANIPPSKIPFIQRSKVGGEKFTLQPHVRVQDLDVDQQYLGELGGVGGEGCGHPVF